MEYLVLKTAIYATILFFFASSLGATPPNPHTFVPDRAAKPSLILANYMRNNISGGVRQAIYVWNLSYKDPLKQVLDLLQVFKVLSDTPVVPKQMLMNQEFELKRLLNTQKMIKALEHFEKAANRTYDILFNYSSLIIGTKQGSMNQSYKELIKEMGRMVKSYNYLAEVTNKEYRQKVMPYYKLNYKKRK